MLELVLSTALAAVAFGFYLREHRCSAQVHGLYADTLRSCEHFDCADGWMPDEDFAAARGSVRLS